MDLAEEEEIKKREQEHRTVKKKKKKKGLNDPYNHNDYQTSQS